MVDIQSWVSTQGQSLLFIYGGRDPWTATAFDLGSAQDSFILTVATGNHGSLIGDLAPADLATAVAAVGRWSGVPAISPRPLTERVRDPLDNDRYRRRGRR